MKKTENRMMVCGWTHSDVTATSTKLPFKAANLSNKSTNKICGPPCFYKLKMKTGQDPIFCPICANPEIWQNQVDHTFNNMVVLSSISLVKNDVLIKWSNKMDKSEKLSRPQKIFGVLIWQIGYLKRQFGWCCCDVRVVHPHIIIKHFSRELS